MALIKGSYRDVMMKNYRHLASLGEPYYVEVVRGWDETESKAVISALDAKKEGQR